MNENGSEWRQPECRKRHLRAGKLSFKPVYLAYALLLIIVVLLLFTALSPAGAETALYTTGSTLPIWQG